MISLDMVSKKKILDFTCRLLSDVLTNNEFAHTCTQEKNTTKYDKEADYGVNALASRKV